MTDREADLAVVEQAKGAIMLRYGVSSCESLAAMARWARETQLSLPDLARALVKGVCQGRVTPETRGVVRWLEHRLRADIGEPPHLPASEQVARPHVPVVRQAPTQPPQPPASAPATRHQWRYASAVHAARALGSS
ncbi:ANTAR domain-containing protein [Nocardioides sp. Soil805]|uniref:ANTAR domain-containing protein n=1 Tax=Nocardioides sp. Soil805 TaxID=1736416 RepID=UPI000702F801|nr:ANTAR domain-containing protein [Nocardioides sp. Soil805]KRF37032.1 hypothetical protein ASG94_06535 [Nocardioides sp. Soil805]